MRMILLLGLLISCSSAFNIDTQTPYVIYGNGGEHFGFSVALHKTDTEGRLLVGAPTADTSQNGVDNAGTVYACRIPTPMEEPRQATRCSTQVPSFDPTGNKFLSLDGTGNAPRNPDGSLKYNYLNDGYMQENKTGQWMGVALRSNGDYVVACAHRFIRVAHNYRKNTFDTQPIGKCSVVSGDLSSQLAEYKPCWGDTTGYEMSSCQAGTSVDISPSSFVFGGPGAYRGEGKAYMGTDFTQSGSIPTNNQKEGGEAGQWYTGYSTALCDVNGDGKEDVITAAPRAETYMGKLFVYTKTGDKLNKQQELDGLQIGEYFGYSLDCGDFNGDGLADVIVGAPYYSRDTSGQARLQSTGRAYVYYGSRETYLHDNPTIIDGGIIQNTQFGSSVKSVGDINKDGMDDVLIGAPFDSRGVVYLYLGTENGVETEPRQSIRPSDLAVSNSITTFGWSLDGGVDMDDNSYPDVMVGTMNGFAVYLRALPIIDLEADIVIEPGTPINRTNPALKVDVPDNPSYQAVAVDIKICFKYLKGVVDGTSQEIEVNYTLTSDYKNSKGFRMYFKPSTSDPKSQNLMGRTIVSTDGTQSCTSMFKSYFNDEIYDFRHIYFKLEADVKDSRSFSSRVTLNDKLIDAAEDRVVMQSGCTKPSGVCQADLVLSPINFEISPKGYDAIAIDRTDYVVFNINVTNKGEDDAFRPELSLTLPRNIIFNRRQAIGDLAEEDVGHIKCITKQDEDLTNKVICSLSQELKVGASEVFGLSVITTNIEDLSQKKLVFDFNARVQEPSEELETLLGDNNQKVTIQVGYPAGIELLGRPLRERQPYSNDVKKGSSSPSTAKAIGPDVRHELEVSIAEGAQEDSFDNVVLEVNWPEYLGDSEDYLLYLVHVSIEDPTEDNTYCVSNGLINEADVEDNTVRKRRRRSADEEEPQDLAPVNCADTDTPGCRNFNCYITRLEKGNTIKFKFMARLWESTLFNVGNVNVTSFVNVTSVAQEDFVFGPEGKSAMKSQFYPSSATKRNYLWIIIGSVIAGILLLVLIIIVLWKCGFFKRKAPPTVRAEAHEQEAEG